MRYNVGLASQTPISNIASAITPALYARTLREVRGSDIEEVLRIFFLFNGFMVTTFVSLSRGIASLYNPLYVNAWVLIIIVSFYALIDGLTSIFSTTALGSCSIDKNGTLSVRKIILSNLFKTPFMRLLGLISSYVFGLSLALLTNSNYLMQSFTFTIGLLIGSIIFFNWFYRTAIKSVKFLMPQYELAVTTIASLISGLYYVISGSSIIIISDFWTDTFKLAINIVIAGSMYLITWYLLSPWFRKLATAGLQMLITQISVIKEMFVNLLTDTSLILRFIITYGIIPTTSIMCFVWINYKSRINQYWLI